MSAEALAAAVGCTQPTIWRIENGKQKASPDLTFRIERFTKGEVNRLHMRPDIFAVAA